MTNPTLNYENELPDDEEPPNELLELMRTFFLIFGMLLYGCLIGHLGLSVWFLIVFAGTVAWYLQKNQYLIRHHQRQIEQFHREIADDEASTLKRLAQYLPSWVHFPDSERAEWLNELLHQLWPFLHEYFTRLLRDKIGSNINDALPDLLKGFRFATISFGSAPIRIGSVKCHRNTARDEIVIDLEVIYASNCDIEVRFKGLPAGIKDFRMRGNLRVELRPITQEWPLVECVSIYFLQNPDIDYTFTKFGTFLHFPGLDFYLKKAIMKQFADRLVLPNKRVIPLVSGLDVSNLKFTRPIAVIHLEVIEGRNLKKAKIFGFGMVYVNISIGNEERTSNTSSTIEKPKWHYSCEAPIYYRKQTISLEVMYSADKHIEEDKDDYIGKATFPVENIAQNGIIDEWLELVTQKENDRKREVHVRAVWKAMEHTRPNTNSVQKMSFVKSASFKSISHHDDDEDFPTSRTSYITTPSARDFHSLDTVDSPFHVDSPSLSRLTSTEPQPLVNYSGSILVIYLEAAKDIPIRSHTIVEPSPQVVFTLPPLSLDQRTRRSTIQQFTCNPYWGDNFNFLLDANLNEDSKLLIEVNDTNRSEDNQIGNTSVSLRSLIEAPKMTLRKALQIRAFESQTFQLQLTISMYFLNAAKI